MSKELLQLEVRFLIARYGRRAVLNALSHLGSVTVGELESEMARLENRKRKKRVPKNIDELVADAVAMRPNTASAIRALAARYDDKTFLPQLRDVRKFLMRHGYHGSGAKSRRAALPKVIDMLVALSAEQLAELLQDADVADETSDYSLLTREIMGGADRRRHAREAHAGTRSGPA